MIIFILGAGSYCGDLDGLQFTEIHLSLPHVLILKVCTTTYTDLSYGIVDIIGAPPFFYL